MKKWLVVVCVILAAAFGMGIYIRTGFTRIDFSNQEQQRDFMIRLLSEKELQETVQEEGEAPQMIIETEDPYTGEIIREVVEGEGLEEEDREKQEKSWMEKWEEELENAGNVALVSASGKIENLFGTMQQEIKILEVFQGNIELEGETAYLLERRPGFWMDENDKIWAGSQYVNFMQEGEEYLVFFDDIPHDVKNLFYGASDQGISYFAMKEPESGFIETEETFVTYRQVEKLEFFCSSGEVYRQLREVKERMIEKYMGVSVSFYSKIEGK